MILRHSLGYFLWEFSPGKATPGKGKNEGHGRMKERREYEK
jgi:hypothetical protein